MASINGITIKGLKKFKDHEGAPCYQGTVYVDGMKMGWWSQDFHGGPDIMDFDQSYLNKDVESYRNSDLVDDEYREYTELDSLLCDVVELMATEKLYKKGLKDGYPVLLEATDGRLYVWRTWYRKMPEQAVIDQFCREKEKAAYVRTAVKAKVYTSLDDFNIVC